jgi:hypothetical protein
MGSILKKTIIATSAAIAFLAGAAPSVDTFASEAANVPKPSPRPTTDSNGGGAEIAPKVSDRDETAYNSANNERDAINQVADRAECDGALNELKLRYVWLGKAVTGSCTIEQAIRLTSVDTPAGEVAFANEPVLNCQFAKTFGRWSREIAAPVFASFMGSRLTSIATGPGVQCRKRIGGGEMKVSEHASGNAIDISAFTLSDGQIIHIGANMEANGAEALNGLRLAACGYFATVLGPGANSAHSHHFHFDSGQHGVSGHYRICE